MKKKEKESERREIVYGPTPSPANEEGKRCF